MRPYGAQEMSISATDYIGHIHVGHRSKWGRQDYGIGQIFRIGTVRRQGPVIAHCTDSEDFPRIGPPPNKG